MEPGVQTPEETLDKASGSCRDSGWLLVQILRHLGIAARFASGYLIQLVADVKSLEGPAGTDRDFTDLHAWAEALHSRRGLDRARSDVRVCWPAKDIFRWRAPRPRQRRAGYRSRPISRTCEFGFAMSVARIHEDPRVTRPTPTCSGPRSMRWASSVDAELVAADVRLTQGGEPTFVSIDDMDGPEWNYTAMSPEEARPRRSLLLRLKARFAPGGLLHDGQGKWYPGEPLPRWALGVYWRTDGEPLWQRRRADCRHARAGSRHGRVGRARSSSARGRARAAVRPCADRVRGRAEAASSGGGAAGERRSAAVPIFRCPASARASRDCCARASTSRPDSCCR